MSQTEGTAESAEKRLSNNRRKLRKGTFSCWECKHRKIRCQFKATSRGICVSCDHRGLSCVRQDLADPFDCVDNEVEQRIMHVEALVNQVIQQRRLQVARIRKNSDIDGVQEIFSTYVTDPYRSSSPFSFPQPIGPAMSSLTDYANSILPCASTVCTILRRGGIQPLPAHVLQLPKNSLWSHNIGLTQREQNSRPSPAYHPIQLAYKLIQLALCLQQLGPVELSEFSDFDSRFPAPHAMRQYISVASSFTTSENILQAPVDGLETLMLEGIFHMNQRNIRAAWMIFRRCIDIARIIRLPDKTGYHEQSVWFCLVYADRTLSLSLGLPFVAVGSGFARDDLLAADIPAQRLERVHALLMGRIIERNLHLQSRGLQASVSASAREEDYKETQSVDYEFKKAARSLPPNWWECPMLVSTAARTELAYNTTIIFSQMHHYHLLVALHQPYIILIDSSDCIYSNSAVPFASREMLSRYLVLRNFYNTLTYRTIDDKACTTAIALLLVHLRGHSLGQANVLEHQRPRDLLLLNRTINAIERTSERLGDELSSSHAKLLRQLMNLEAEVENGAKYAISVDGTDDSGADERGHLSIKLPYFGTISIRVN